MRIGVIALNTFKEAVRNKIFYLLVVFGILFAFSSKVLSLLTIGNKERVIMDVGLASIHFFSVLVTVFTGINLVFKEIDKRTIYNILSKPVSRLSFILGKFAGLALTCLVALFAMTAIFSLFFLVFTGVFRPLVALFFLMTYIELLLIISISLLFSSFTTPILATIFTILIYLLGHVVWTFNEFKTQLVDPLAKTALSVIYYLLPNLEKFNIKSEVVMNRAPEAFLVLTSSLYGMVYLAAVLTLTALVINRREF